MAKTLPKYKVEISFTASNSSGLSFFDVTADVRLYAGVTLAGGRTDQFSDVTAGTAAFTLDNMADAANSLVAGRYSPDNTSSPHFPNVTRGRAVRISAIEDVAVGYTQIYYGFIDSITPGFDNETGLVAYSSITCVDLSSMLSRAGLNGKTLLDVYLGGSAPTDWWPMDDQAGTPFPANVAGPTRALGVNQGGGTNPLFTFQSDGLPYGDDGHSVLIDGASLNAVPASAAQYDFTVGWTIGTFFRIPETGQNIDLITLASDPSFTNFAAMVVDNLGEMEWVVSAGSISSSLTLPGPVNDGAWHYAGLAYGPSAGGVLRFYLDGQTTVLNGVGTAALAMPIFYLGQSLITGAQYQLAHCAGWQRTVLPTEIDNIALAGINGFAGETSVARVQRILGLAGYTPTIIGTPAIQDMAPWHDTSGSFWAMASTVKQTELGILYIDKTGVPTFRTRLAQFNQTAQLTLASGTYEDTLKFIQDATGFFNDYTATAYGSDNPQEVTNATSVTNDGPFTDNQTIESTSDVEALSYAQIQVGAGKAVTRLPQLDIDLMTQQVTFPGLLAAWWALDLGELLALQALPSAAPVPALSLFFEGYSSTLTDTGYDASLNLAAAQLAAWVLQDSTLGVLDSTTILA